MRLSLCLALISLSAAVGLSPAAPGAAAPGAAAPDWPYSPPVAKAPPAVRNAAWCRNPIDWFVLAKLEAKGLKPNPPATRTALLRRVYLDLVGVPPTPAEADRFLN